jgi:hypothetical protein
VFDGLEADIKGEYHAGIKLKNLFLAPKKVTKQKSVDKKPERLDFLDITLELDLLPEEDYVEVSLYSVFEGLEADLKRPSKTELQKQRSHDKKQSEVPKKG